jgi:metal-dependent amidase/aminoacylase/carboxypeptidase family protein
LTNYLEKNGFKLTYKAAGLETAFMAEFSNSHSGRRVGFCCEYDALPGYKNILKEIHVSELI